MKRHIASKAFLLPTLLVSLFITAVFAGSTSWSYSNYDHGGYVPKSGSFTEWTSSGFYWSRVEFEFDEYNVSQILDYNNGGDNPGTHCDNEEAYLTLDVSAIPDNSWDLEIDAYRVYSNLPLPRNEDTETNGFGWDNDESEVVTRGEVEKDKSYYMTTSWHDNRDGDTDDGGYIQAQFAMSDKGWKDYNNCIQSNTLQIYNAYGNDYGSI